MIYIWRVRGKRHALCLGSGRISVEEGMQMQMKRIENNKRGSSECAVIQPRAPPKYSDKKCDGHLGSRFSLLLTTNQPTLPALLQKNENEHKSGLSTVWRIGRLGCKLDPMATIDFFWRTVLSVARTRCNLHPPTATK